MGVIFKMNLITLNPSVLNLGVIIFLEKRIENAHFTVAVMYVSNLVVLHLFSFKTPIL
jgi:hypothetical protein